MKADASGRIDRAVRDLENDANPTLQFRYKGTVFTIRAKPNCGVSVECEPHDSAESPEILLNGLQFMAFRAARRGSGQADEDEAQIADRIRRGETDLKMKPKPKGKAA